MNEKPAMDSKLLAAIFAAVERSLEQETTGQRYVAQEVIGRGVPQNRWLRSGREQIMTMRTFCQARDAWGRQPTLYTKE